MQVEADAVLTEMRKADEFMRERLYILQVWRKYDFETANKLARKKAGVFLDPDLVKVLKEREKRMDREKRERDKEGSGDSRRFKGNTFYSGEHLAKRLLMAIDRISDQRPRWSWIQRPWCYGRGGEKQSAASGDLKCYICDHHSRNISAGTAPRKSGFSFYCFS